MVPLGGLPATDGLRKGLNELTEVCQHVLGTFQVSGHLAAMVMPLLLAISVPKDTVYTVQ